MKQETFESYTKSLEETKNRRLATWTKRLEEARREGDKVKERVAEETIWYINQNY